MGNWGLISQGLKRELNTLWQFVVIRVKHILLAITISQQLNKFFTDVVCISQIFKVFNCFDG